MNKFINKLINYAAWIGLVGWVLFMIGAILMSIHCWNHPYNFKLIIYTKWFDWVLFIIGTIFYSFGMTFKDRK